MAMTSTERTKKRRTQLDTLAREYKFETWHRLETAILRRKVKLIVDEEKNSKDLSK